MTAIVDYGVGNLYSLLCSLSHVGAQAVVTRDEGELRAADRVILPGVGAFGDAAEKLRTLRLDALLQELAAKGKPLMGICLGMQLLFDKSLEYGEHKGLGLISGVVKSLARELPQGMKVPHMGWNGLDVEKADDSLLLDVPAGAFVYYVHSFYAAQCKEALVATSDYGGVCVAGVVRSGRVCGAQFHPEKSGEIGMRILRNFVREGSAC